MRFVELGVPDDVQGFWWKYFFARHGVLYLVDLITTSLEVMLLHLRYLCQFHKRTSRVCSQGDFINGGMDLISEHLMTDALLSIVIGLRSSRG